MRSGEYDIAFVPGFLATIADPSELTFDLFHSDGSANFSHLADPAFDSRIEVAAADLPQRATDVRGDRSGSMGSAPIAVLGDLNAYDFFSTRIGCQSYHPVYGIEIAELRSKK